jgi:hypothetical protein
MSRKAYFAETITHTATTVGVATALAALVGYREKDGVPADQLMPSLGPVPLDVALGFGFHAVGIAIGNGMAAQVFSKAGDGSFAVFGVSAGQSLGGKLYDTVKGSGGLLTGRQAPRAMSQGAPQAREYRDANGQHRKVQVQNAAFDPTR